MDIEHRLGITSTQGLACSYTLTGLFAIVATVTLFAILFSLEKNIFSVIMLDRGWTQHAATLLGFWCAFILLFKRRRLKIQRKSLRYAAIPDDHQFVLSSQTADQVVAQIHANAADPERFLVYNRILTAIANLKNMGRISDADDILSSHGDRDANAHETSFAIVNGLLWAIPVLGFIGTVVGLSGAIGKFAAVLKPDIAPAEMVAELVSVTASLSTAFDTTLVALILALVLQLWMTAQKAAEEKFLDDCDEYCLTQIVGRIKILPYEQTREI